MIILIRWNTDLKLKDDIVSLIQSPTAKILVSRETEPDNSIDLQNMSRKAIAIRTGKLRQANKSELAKSLDLSKMIS